MQSYTNQILRILTITIYFNINMNNVEARDNEVFMTIENIEKRFTKSDLEQIVLACKKRLKSYKENDTVEWMKELFESDPDLSAIRWGLYGPDESRKKWIAYADTYCPQLDSPPKDYRNDYNWDAMDDFATETPGKPWMDQISKNVEYTEHRYFVVYERDFKDFNDYKLIVN